jgi:RHS repeat-associated protein
MPANLSVTDSQHSAIATFSAGARSNRVRYGPFGEGTLCQEMKIGFTGMLREPAHYYACGNGARLYLPTLKRFASSDRLCPFSQGGLNSYAYCKADPVNFVDLHGLSPFKFLNRFMKALKREPDISDPLEVQSWILKTAKRTKSMEDGATLHTYDGWVFRGDSRPPETLFKEGFELRRQVANKKTITGQLGGFGGGHDSLDPDGGGISASGFYKKDGAGAYFYGAGSKRGGYTYLIDARGMEGFELYRNWGQASASYIPSQPWEVNYGTPIAANRIRGVYSKDHRFSANTSYRR